jgi:hypothetical protein
MKPEREKLPSNATEMVNLAIAEAHRALNGEDLRDCVHRQFAAVALANANAGGLPGCTHGLLGNKRASLMLGMGAKAHHSSDLRKRHPGHWAKAVRFGAKLRAEWSAVEEIAEKGKAA